MKIQQNLHSEGVLTSNKTVEALNTTIYTDIGSNNAIAITITGNINLVDGVSLINNATQLIGIPLHIKKKGNFGNYTSMTIKVNDLTAIACRRRLSDGTISATFSADILKDGDVFTATYNGTYFLVEGEPFVNHIINSDIPNKVESQIATRASTLNVNGVIFKDTRNDASKPSDIQSQKYLQADFKTVASVGSPPVTAGGTPLYAHILSGSAYGDGSGGYPFQMSIGNGLAVRKGKSATEWDEWMSFANIKDLNSRGFMGINADNPDPINKDWNNVLNTGFYMATGYKNSPSFIPTASNWYYVQVIKHMDAYVVQQAWSFNANRTAIRTKNNSVWSEWKEIPTMTTKGTWLPTVQGTGVVGNPTYSVREGTYQVIGNICFLQFRITYTSLGGMSGFLRLRSFPFIPTVTTGISVDADYVKTNKPLRAFFSSAGSSDMILDFYDGTSVVSGAENLQDNSSLRGYGFYFI